jgi:hypothetical protein
VKNIYLMLPSVASTPSAPAACVLDRNSRTQAGTTVLVAPRPEPRKRIGAWEQSVSQTDVLGIPMVENAHVSALGHTGTGGAAFGYARTETRLRERPKIC